jgi:hypothetical protein
MDSTAASRSLADVHHLSEVSHETAFLKHRACTLEEITPAAIERSKSCAKPCAI